MTKTAEFVKGAPFALQNVKVLWANVQEDNPDTKYERCWKATAILKEAEAKSLEAVGFNIKEKDGEYTLTLKTKCTQRDGTPNKPPRVVGRDGETPFTQELGNGTLVNIQGYAKYCEVSGNTYLPAYINAVQVIDHVEYNGGSGFTAIEEEVAPF